MGKGNRRFSQASYLVASYIQDLVSKDDRQDHDTGLPYLESLSGYSLTVPLFQNLEDDPFLTDKRMKSALEEAGLINWCPGMKRLVPLSVTNNGNTLCHSASMSLWGVQDSQLHLRCLVKKALTSQAEENFKKRWQKEVFASRDTLHGLNYQQGMEAEWQVLIELTSETNRSVRSNNPLYEPLEEFHIFVLANVLRRPIIIFADRPVRSVEPQEMTICFAALYLPLLWPSNQCCKSPVVLGYCDNYFCPLVTFGTALENTNSKEPCAAVVPLVGLDKVPIEQRYLTEDEEVNKHLLTKEYLLTSEIETTMSNKVIHTITVAKLISNPMNESQNLIKEFLNQRESQGTTEPEIKTAPQVTRKVSKFRCGNKTCSKLIDQDHLFPYCSECYPKFSTSASKLQPTRRKMNSANTVVPPTSLEIECETVGCPYFAAVSCFPYCQRCKSVKDSQQSNLASSSSTNTPTQSMSVEDRWQKLAMGVVDQELVSGMMDAKIDGPSDEILFANLHNHIPVEDGEKFGMGGATSSRSMPVDASKFQNPSATGARSAPQRKVSREELRLATNSIEIESPDDWKRKVSWINEPCIRQSCCYFASARTYPYCNQCASDMQKAPAAAQRNRKVSGSCSLSPLIQED